MTYKNYPRYVDDRCKREAKAFICSFLQLVMGKYIIQSFIYK